MRVAGAALALAAGAAADTRAARFDAYLAEHGRSYGAAEYKVRKGHFEANLAKVQKQNADPSATWKAAMNRFADLSPAEFKAQRCGLHKGAVRAGLSTKSALQHKLGKAVPASVDWRDNSPKVVTDPKDQKSCGSCWAFSTAETVESAVAIATGTLLTLSEQQLVSCSKNPEQCGGSGGCQGSTQPIAFEYIVQAGGMVTEDTYSYTSGSGDTGTCKNKKLTPKAATITGHVVLPTNDYNAHMDAIANKGPLAITVAAEPWQLYSGGVFTCTSSAKSCADLDHAVQLVGYGGSGDKMYWLVRNSWGGSWGEEGYIRVKRYGDGKEPCAEDTTPLDGIGCAANATSMSVCGETGLLSSTSYPVGAAVAAPAPATPQPAATPSPPATPAPKPQPPAPGPPAPPGTDCLDIDTEAACKAYTKDDGCKWCSYSWGGICGYPDVDCP